ncbi:MAG TPA: TonB-dependent receptor, partial [Sphingobacteriaceae bacterium]|nr:TonB-dependent receptor [Sphingobacteriaceae bacterium]
LTEEVIVQATRASENSATTYRNVSRAELAKNNLGQDLTYLLDQTPGVVVTSDAGAGVGYTGIRVRGSDPTRVNVTINGVPLNNPESMGAFLINLPDFASSVDNIQLQRGVGTSTNGAGAFGASMNIQTTSLEAEPYAELDNSFGSYNTLKNTVRLGTGLLNERFSFDGRLSQIKSDGYIDRAFSDLQSFFLTGAWHGQNHLLRANVFSGKEKTYQAWNGVPEEMLETNRRYNEFTYENQTDNYVQTHYQLHYAQGLSPKTHLNAALHYTRGAGYYEEFRENDSFSRYGLEDLNIGGTTINSSDLVRRRWLDNHFYGATWSLTHHLSQKLDLTLGGAYNDYIGGHYGEVIWARFASDGNLGDRYYEDEGLKDDFNIFAKAEYQAADFSLYADVQYRTIRYTFVGYDRNLVQLDQTDHLHFFNPKIGMTYRLSDQSQVYTSVAIANKEPIRDDYVDSSVSSRPKPEQLRNIEAGYRISGSRYRLGANVYGMFYKNQLILTGMINDVGEANRQNVEDSYRIGLELDAQWQPFRQLTWSATAAFSDNQIRNFTEYVDLHDYSGQQSISYDKTHIALSPAFVGSSEIAYRPVSSFELALISKYVSRQYLDNTTSLDRSLDAFFVNNLRVAYTTSYRGAKEVGLTLALNNIFGEKYAANGYTWGHLNEDGSRASYNYYYPQATANFLLGLHLKF